MRERGNPGSVDVPVRQWPTHSLGLLLSHRLMYSSIQRHSLPART